MASRFSGLLYPCPLILSSTSTALSSHPFRRMVVVMRTVPVISLLILVQIPAMRRLPSSGVDALSRPEWVGDQHGHRNPRHMDG